MKRESSFQSFPSHIHRHTRTGRLELDSIAASITHSTTCLSWMTLSCVLISVSLLFRVRKLSLPSSRPFSSFKYKSRPAGALMTMGGLPIHIYIGREREERESERESQEQTNGSAAAEDVMREIGFGSRLTLRRLLTLKMNLNKRKSPSRYETRNREGGRERESSRRRPFATVWCQDPLIGSVCADVVE